MAVRYLGCEQEGGCGVVIMGVLSRLRGTRSAMTSRTHANRNRPVFFVEVKQPFACMHKTKKDD